MIEHAKSFAVVGKRKVVGFPGDSAAHREFAGQKTARRDIGPRLSDRRGDGRNPHAGSASALPFKDVFDGLHFQTGVSRRFEQRLRVWSRPRLHRHATTQTRWISGQTQSDHQQADDDDNWIGSTCHKKLSRQM